MLTILRIEQKGAIFRELATMVRAGMSLGEAWGVLQTRRAYPRLRQFIVDAARRVPQGTRLSEVVKDYPDEFSGLTQGVIAAGEETGRLEEALDTVAGYWEREYSLRQMVSRETFYPKALAVFVVLIPVATQAIIIAIQRTFWAGLWVLVKTLLIYALILAIPAMLIYMVYKSITNTEQGRQTIDAAKLRVPLFGPVIRKLALAKFMRALAYAYSAGLPMARVLELAAPVTGNTAISRHLLAAVPYVRKGGKLSEILRAAPEVDDIVVHMLQTGEQTGNIDETMERVAEHFEIASESSIHRMATLALPLGVIIVGIIVAIKIIGFYAAYFAAF